MIKGILIFLIVLGHNMVFTLPLEKWGIMSYLYLFHIRIFFLLPFLYGARPLGMTRFGLYFVRFYWPYLLLAVLLAIGYGVSHAFSQWTWQSWGKLLFICDADSLRSMCGLSMLWFLPAMMSTLMMRDWYYASGCVVKSLLLVCSACCSILFVFFPHIHEHICAWVPFGIPTACAFLLPGVIMRWVWGSVPPHSSWACFSLSLAIYASASYLYFAGVATHPDRETWLFHILQLFMPFVCMILLQKLVECAKGGIKIVSLLGKESMKLYLISPFVGYMAFFVCQKSGLVNWWMGIITQLVIVCVSYFIASKILIGRLESLLLPRSPENIKSALHLS